MKQLGVIALEEERAEKRKWYQLGGHRWTHAFAAGDIFLTVFFAGKSLKKTMAAVRSSGIRDFVCTQRAKRALGEPPLDGLRVYDGRALYERLLPSLIKKVCKIAGLSPQTAALAITDDDSALTLRLIEALCGDFKYITLISSDRAQSHRTYEKVLDEWGLALVIAPADTRVKCDIAVRTGAQIPVLPKDTILIDAWGENTITRKNAIDWAEVSLDCRIPYDIDSLALSQAAEQLAGKAAPLKIRAFRAGDSYVSTAMLAKNIDN